MERQRASIDDHNKQYYELTKSKDQCQATRKEQYVYFIELTNMLFRNFKNVQAECIKLQISAGECITIKSIWFKRRFSQSRSESKIHGWQAYFEWQGQRT